MTNPEITFDGEYYHAPFEAIEYPAIEEGYLPENVHVHFNFGAHATKEDFIGTAELLNSADIYIPEAANHGHEELQFYQRLVKSNRLNAAKLMARYSLDPFSQAQSEALAGTYKTVLLIDSSEDDRLYIPSETFDLSPPLETALRGLFVIMFQHAQAWRKRDSIMITKLGPGISRAIENHPKLKDKDEVRVLVRLGAAHETIYQFLSNNLVTQNQVSATHQYPCPEIYKLLRPFDEHGLVNRNRKIASNQPISRQIVLTSFIINTITMILNKAQIGDKSPSLPGNLLEVLLSTGQLDEVADLTRRVASDTASSADLEFMKISIKKASEIKE